jgi:hypothetical protein
MHTSHDDDSHDRYTDDRRWHPEEPDLAWIRGQVDDMFTGNHHDLAGNPRQQRAAQVAALATVVIFLVFLITLAPISPW